MKAGAGGYWKRHNEKFDKKIPLQKGLSCVAAVGEMLLRERGIIVPYQDILGIIQEKASFYDLAKVLNQITDRRWEAAFLPPQKIDFVLGRKDSFGVILQEPGELGHAVLVKNIGKNRTLLIYDSFDQTSYEMTEEDFNNCWGGGIIYEEN
jgi:ABC-type bacteriocin/lantibiotic exporter with double-glycine peptidase domain